MASRLERWTVALVLIATAGSVIFTVIFPAIGHDADVHLNWLDQFSMMVRNGIFYPRWLALSNCRFGSTTFYFYPPLPYLVASIFRFVVPFAPTGYYNAVSFIATVGSVITSRLLLRQYSRDRLRVLTASLLYSFIAYRYADIFVRDALGEHWALTFLPLIFVTTRDRYLTIALRAIGWTGILLSSVPILILSGITLLVFCIVDRNIKNITHHIIAAVIAALTSAEFLLPASLLKQYIHVTNLISPSPQTTGFILIDLFLFNGWLRFLGVITLVIGSAIVITRKPRETDTRWWWVTFVACALQLPLFWWLWSAPGFREFVQFSWRLCGVLMLSIAVIYASSKRAMDHWLVIALSTVTIIGIARMSGVFREPRPLPYDMYRIDASQYVPIWGPQNRYVAEGQVRAHFGDAPATMLGLTDPTDSVSIQLRWFNRQIFKVSLHQATPVRFHQYYWPYWKLFRGGQAIPLSPDANGFATANLPPGQYQLTLSLVKSDAEIYGKYISLFGLLCLVGISTAAAYREMTMDFDRRS